MRTRTHRIEVRLNDSEYAKFTKAVSKYGISGQAFIRLLISGYIPKEKPPPDYYLMTEELRRAGSSLNQIARVAHATGMIDTKSYDENVSLYRETLRKISHAILVPEKRGP